LFSAFPISFATVSDILFLTASIFSADFIRPVFILSSAFFRTDLMPMSEITGQVAPMIST
jgi:hypothetical protein